MGNKSNEHDEKFKLVFAAIRQILTLPEKKKRPIGFVPWMQGDVPFPYSRMEQSLLKTKAL